MRPSKRPNGDGGGAYREAATTDRPLAFTHLSRPVDESARPRASQESGRMPVALRTPSTRADWDLQDPPTADPAASVDRHDFMHVEPATYARSDNRSRGP
ncbi:hypothetical protein ACWPKO_30000 (plasmid) [Coraliomargarita sp. W4R53]